MPSRPGEASMSRAVQLAFLTLITGCAPNEPEPLRALRPGAPVAGAAEGTLRLPVGTPLAAFSSRCGCLDSTSEADKRDSAYASSFVESAGVFIRPTIKVVWLSNGDQHLVMTKTDVGFAFDGVVGEVTRRLEEATGESLDGQVTWSTTHTHSSYGAFTANEGFMLGADRFNREIFERLVQQVTDVALEAYGKRRAAALGFGVTSGFDPDDTIYEDRRDVNDDLVLFPDEGPEQGGKDPTMHLLRVDDATTGDPLAVVFGFGFHPVTFWEENPLVSADAIGPIEMEVAESFTDAPAPVVAMYLQGAAGDANVVGVGEGWRRTEAVGALVRDHVLALRTDTPTSAEPIVLETFVRSVPMHGDAIHVTRDGTVDWSYPRWSATDAESYQPDNLVFASDGSLRGDFDEWYTDFGAAFCGWGGFELPIGGLPNVAEEVDGACPAGKDCNYQHCVQVSLMSRLLQAFFYEPGETIELPARGMAQTLTAATRFGPIGVRGTDGTTGTDDVLLGFFPGEPVHMYAEAWRRRAATELGVQHTALIGYSMDHEGYLLLPEDWLRGGYEPDITFSGPLGAEWILENVLHDAASILGTDTLEPQEAGRGPEVYDYPALPQDPPDITPDAGTPLTGATRPPYLWVPGGFSVDLDLPEAVPRVQGIVQAAWIGGDPAVDDPRVTLQVQDGGVWRAVTSRTGREINNDLQDFVLGHTPDPLFPANMPQTHTWWVAWQAVGHIHDRAALPLGLYRLHVEGRAMHTADSAFPWDSEPYVFDTAPFTVVPGSLRVEPSDAGFTVSLPAPPSGFRLVDLDGDVTGDNPVRGTLSIVWALQSGETRTEPLVAPAPVDGRTPVPSPVGEVVVGVTVRDEAGNEGAWPPP